ncbi:MAG: DUF6478 family protein [Pseudomonadota bacterium]
MTGLRFWIFALINRLHRGAWARWGTPEPNLSTHSLRRIRRQARVGADTLRAVERAAQAALTGPEAVAGSCAPTRDAEGFTRPAVFDGNVDAAFHEAPESGLALGPDITLHHDLSDATFSIALRSRGLVIEGYEVRGSFLSLALALPEADAPRTTRDRLVRLAYDFDMELAGPVFARLNLRHGPNVEQITRALDLEAAETWVEFDVFYTEYEPARGTGLWIDLIFEPPRMNRITIRDLAIMRRPRISL